MENGARDESGESSERKKRSTACVNCRKARIKCVFSSTDGPRACDRCRAKRVECKIEAKYERVDSIEQFSERLQHVEEMLESISGRIPAVLVPPPSIARSQSLVEAASLSQRSPGVTQTSPGVASSNSSSPQVLRDPHNIIWRKRNHSAGGTVSGLLSDITNSQVPHPDIKPPKRIKPDPSGSLSMSADEVDECIELTKLSRYLPVFVLDYVIHFDGSMRQRSPLLLTTVLSVASLYYPKYRSRHASFRTEVEQLASTVCPEQIRARRPDVTAILDDVLALAIAGAWLGGELGFTASLIASDIVDQLLPDDTSELLYDAPVKSMLGALGLATYIIEKRLRIIHDRPNTGPPDATTRRDMFLPVFLTGLSGGSRMRTKLDAGELKATANVELCALITMYQQDLSDKLEVRVMVHWNSQLDKWLGEWIGKLTVMLKPSSWKPLLLSFHYAKLFLNLRVIEDTKVVPELQSGIPAPLPPDERDFGFIKFVGLAEKAALDVLEMLIHDEDIQRLIGVGPVFYPTIFVTAGAFLLKLLRVSPTIRYQASEITFMEIIAEATAILDRSTKSDVLPCHETVKNLNVALDKVRKLLVDQGRLEAPSEAVLPASTPDNRMRPPPPIPIVDQWSFSPINQPAVVGGDVAEMAPQADNLWRFEADPTFIMDAHSTNILQSLFGPSFSTGP